MARIKQVGAGRKTSGKVDGLVYVVRHGVTFARALPTMPKSMFNTPAARLRQAKFTLIQWYLKDHAGAIESLIERKGNSSPRNQFYSLNAKPLGEALASLAQSYVAGQMVKVSDIESAVTAFATANSDRILIANRQGYKKVYLSGAFPSTVTLVGDGVTPITIVTDNGTPSTPGGNTGSEQVTLTVAASPSNGGTVTGGGTVAKGSQVTLNATANTGYTFSRWSDGVSTAQRSVTASASATYTAEFTANAPTGGNSDD